MAKAPTKKNDSSANLGFEAKLWLTADKLRNNMDAAEYKHVVLGLIFLKYTFRRDLQADLRAGTATRVSTNLQPQSHSAGLFLRKRTTSRHSSFNFLN